MTKKEEKELIEAINELNESVDIICYGQKETMLKTKALRLYNEAFRGSEGHEKQRYANILADLNDGRTLCWDGEEDEIPTGYHVCQYCGSLAYGNDADRLCEDCQMVFGHSSINEL